MGVGTYTDYFRTLAVQHKDLQHNPASETGDSDYNEKKFARWTYDDVVSGLRTKMGFPAMLYELYETTEDEQNKNDIKGMQTGAISIADLALKENELSTIDVFTRTEAILYDIINRVWQDHYGKGADACSRPFREIYFDKNDVVSFGPIGSNLYGWRWEFRFRFRDEMKVAQAPREGAFG